MENKSCCFIGHRKIENKELLASLVENVIEKLITEENVRIFNFGSNSDFDDICH